MSHGGGGGGEGVEVNLIPMIDIVIQLITFFLMLVNLEDANFDERVRLPIADLAKPTEMAIDEALVLNINSEGLVTVGPDKTFGVGTPEFRRHMILEANWAEKNMRLAKRTVKRVGGRPDLWTTIIVRADKDVEFLRIQQIMRICQELGFTKFALRASPEKERM